MPMHSLHVPLPVQFCNILPTVRTRDKGHMHVWRLLETTSCAKPQQERLHLVLDCLLTFVAPLGRRPVGGLPQVAGQTRRRWAVWAHPQGAHDAQGAACRPQVAAHRPLLRLFGGAVPECLSCACMLERKLQCGMLAHQLGYHSAFKAHHMTSSTKRKLACWHPCRRRCLPDRIELVCQAAQRCLPDSLLAPRAAGAAQRARAARRRLLRQRGRGRRGAGLSNCRACGVRAHRCGAVVARGAVGGVRGGGLGV